MRNIYKWYVCAVSIMLPSSLQHHRRRFEHPSPPFPPQSSSVRTDMLLSGDDQPVRDGCMHVPIANGRPSLPNRLVCGGSIRASFVGTGAKSGPGNTYLSLHAPDSALRCAACLPGSSCSASRLERKDPAAALPPCQKSNCDSPYPISEDDSRE
ncbi:hypothetical protein K466DRAFT_387201 [Polyporus arcularius HHB13444]|uniref:Uncharacterized protein n=1 Tax=Polyporus arcularius HHB13444 TaxID=1314778 RepID=A0A5C3NWC6_9APHY|nr:hypothetical protein K466DRAFT_387201 [Polyporus arcularius HHB13444]